MLNRDPYGDLPQLPLFTLTSEDIKDGDEAPDWMLSALMGIQAGKDANPQLSWSGFPPETKSFVVTCYDPDAPTPSGFWHWCLSNIPADVHSIERAAATTVQGTRHTNDAGTDSYVGIAPPAGDGKHRYIFCVTAVDTETLDVDESTSAAVVNFNLFLHGIARAFLTVTHEEKES